MNKEDIRIVYMGTPQFAVEPLDSLLAAGYRVAGVVTMPDKPVGRHQNSLSPSPVKEYALAHGLKVLQPARLSDGAFLDELRSLRADLQVVVAFRMLPQVVWSMPPLGTFNLHAALLPQYRGAAPINWAIINGETQTGVTTFFLDKDIDTGSVIRRVPVPIADTDNAADVHDKLMHLGARLVVETVDDIVADKVVPVPQNRLTADGPLRPAPKIFKDTCRIDWSLPVKQTYDFVRGLSPYPAAWTELTNAGITSVLKVYASSKEPCTPAHPVGAVVTDGKNFLKVAQTDGYQNLKIIQAAGKKRMDVLDFLRGFHPSDDAMVK